MLLHCFAIINKLKLCLVIVMVYNNNDYNVARHNNDIQKALALIMSLYKNVID